MTEQGQSDKQADEAVRLITNTDEPVRFPWPTDCFVQGGARGLVIDRTPTGSTASYFSAFVEAYPVMPSGQSTFLRGQGDTIADAERACWGAYQGRLGCDVYRETGQHDFETGGYTNGAGVCVSCGLFVTGVFTLAEVGSLCVVCDAPSNWSSISGRIVCQQHSPPSMLSMIDAIDDWRADGYSDAAKPADMDWWIKHLPDPRPHVLDMLVISKAVRDGRAERVESLVAGRHADKEGS